MRRTALIVLVTLSSATAHTANAPVVTPLVTATQTMTGQAIEVPVHPKVIVSIVTIPSGAKLPVHKHPYARYGYVLEGTLTGTQLATGKTATYSKGDFLIESRDQWHFAVNKGAVAVKILVIDQVPADAASNTVLKTP